MQSCSNRSTLIICGLVTRLVLSGAALALGFHNGWLRTESGAVMPEAVIGESQPSDARSGRGTPIEAKPSPAGSTQTATQDEAELYRQKLDEAYRGRAHEGALRVGLFETQRKPHHEVDPCLGPFFEYGVSAEAAAPVSPDVKWRSTWRVSGIASPWCGDDGNPAAEMQRSRRMTGTRVPLPGSLRI